MKKFKIGKQIIIEIFIALFICSIVLFIYFGGKNYKASQIASSNVSNNYNNTASNSILVELDTSDNKADVPEIVTDEKASEKELKKGKVTKKEVEKSKSPYYIKVNYKANVVTIYTKDKNDKYTIPYKAMVCSCGTYTPTSGTYKTTNKYKWGKLIHNVYGQYSTRIVGSILFHSVPYSSNKADTLLFDEYDKLGTTASAGCVRLTVKDAKWIYDNCPKGTMVEFYSDSNPGPLGKPTAQKISSVEECRNWDPTDPAAGNPWHTYKPKEEKPVEDVSNNVANDTTNNSIIDNNIINNSNNLNNTIIDNSSNLNNTIIDNSSSLNNSIIDNSSSLNNSITDTNSTIDNNTTDIPNTNIEDNNIDNSGNSADINTDNNSAINNAPSDSNNTDIYVYKNLRFFLYNKKTNLENSLGLFLLICFKLLELH